MKNCYCILGLFLISLLLSSCSKWLDEKPNQNLAIPTTLKDFQVLLDNADKFNLQSASYHEIASDGHYVLPANVSTLNDIQYNAYLWTKEKSNNSAIDWVKTYSNIFTSNLVIEGLSKLNVNDSFGRATYNDILGQALVHRSIKFYEVVQSWGPPLMESAEKNIYGIPLRLESDINLPTKRSTLRQTYDQIIGDLLIATKLLPVTPLYKTRPSKPAAFAMLARVFLAIEEYEKAAIYSDSCLKLFSTLVDFNTLPANANWPLIRFNNEVIMHSALINYTALGSRLLVDQTLYDQYEARDLRKIVFFRKNANGTIAWKGNYTGGVTIFCGLAADEQFLIRAECHARAGDFIGAINDLNTLRKTRWDKNAPYVNIIPTNAEDALKKVLVERQRELLLRGTRWSDLRRLNRDPRFRIVVTRSTGATSYTLEPESYKYTLPIPDDIILQTGIIQNPGWGK